jgi:hypothetical protein
MGRLDADYIVNEQRGQPVPGVNATDRGGVFRYLMFVHPTDSTIDFSRTYRQRSRSWSARAGLGMVVT